MIRYDVWHCARSPPICPFDVDAKIQNERIYEMKYKTVKKITYTEHNGIFIPTFAYMTSG